MGRASTLMLTVAATGAIGAFVASAAGCYRPDPQAGAPCGANGACPSDLVCRNDICVTTGGSPPDDAPVDAPPMIDTLPPGDTLGASIGCADGTREAFTSTSAFPNVAGCAATWTGPLSMRAAPTGQPCGNAQPCAAPADACAAGWHVCGTSGDPTDLTATMTAADCQSAGNSADMTARFAGALSHCSSYANSVCAYDLPRDCAPSSSCAEPVCCGLGCRYSVGCPQGAFASMQGVAGTLENGCGSMLAADVSGVLCCR